MRIAVAIRLRAWYDGGNIPGIEAADALEQIANLFVLQMHLSGEMSSKVLASAAICKIPGTGAAPAAAKPE